MKKLGVWLSRLTGLEELRRQRNRERHQFLKLVSAVGSLEDELLYLFKPRPGGGCLVKVGAVFPEDCPLLCRIVQGLPLVPPDEGEEGASSNV